MGITATKEDFISLEGYANKDDSERKAILDNARIIIGATDTDIANFLGTNEIFSAFIRGIILKCVELKTAEINAEIQAYLEALNKEYKDELSQMNRMFENLKERAERQEQYYFGTTTEKNHMTWIEIGSTDQNDKDKFSFHRSGLCPGKNKFFSNYATQSTTGSDDLNMEQEMNRRHKRISLLSQEEYRK